MKFSPDRPYSDPEKAARKIIEIANRVEAGQNGRILVEKINAPFLFRERATPADLFAKSVDQRMRLECGVGFRQLRTCRNSCAAANSIIRSTYQREGVTRSGSSGRAPSQPSH